MPKRIEVNKIITQALPGSHLTDCMEEAIQLAFEKGFDVELNHNSNKYLVDRNYLIDTIINLKRE